jgi:hypothetical protein
MIHLFSNVLISVSCLVVSDKKIFKISANENTLWTPAAMLDFKSAPKTGPSSEHFWQVWLISLKHAVFSSPGLRPCELLSWVSVRPSVS